MASSPVDDRLAEEFEQLLRAGSHTVDLQDKMMEALKWTEGSLVNTAILHRLQEDARRTLRRFLEEQPRYTILSGQTPDPACADDLMVEHDGRGHITIQLPNEVRRWLLQTQSMIAQ